MFAAERRGTKGTESIHFWAFACLGDPAQAEVGLVPLDKCSGMGLRDIPPLFPGVAAVELDRYFTPAPLSIVYRRVTGHSWDADEEAVDG